MEWESYGKVTARIVILPFRVNNRPAYKLVAGFDWKVEISKRKLSILVGLQVRPEANKNSGMRAEGNWMRRFCIRRTTRALDSLWPGKYLKIYDPTNPFLS